MEPLVTIPQILVFNAPYNRLQSREMTLINNTEQVLMFKLKTNNAQHYVVKPTVGLVEPYSTSKVLISLCRFDFQPRTCYQHRFIVETFYIPVEGLQQCDREAPKAFFKRTPRSDMGVVRIRVRLEATPALPPKERLTDVPAQAVAEPLLGKQPALEEPQKAKRIRGPRSWLFWTLLILAFVVAGIFRNEGTSKASSHNPVLDNVNLSI